MRYANADSDLARRFVAQGKVFLELAQRCFESGSLIGRKTKRNSIGDSAPNQGLLDFQLLFVLARTLDTKTQSSSFRPPHTNRKCLPGELLGHFLDVLSERKYAQQCSKSAARRFLMVKSRSSRSNIITRMQIPRHPRPMKTAFRYRGHRVEIMGDPSAPTITVDGKDYTPFYKGSDLSPEMWIIGHIDTQAHSTNRVQVKRPED